MNKTYKARRKGKLIEVDAQILRWRKENRKLGRHLDVRTERKREARAKQAEQPMSLNLFYSNK